MQRNVGRPLFPNGYNNKYPPQKRELYEKLVDFILLEGGEIIPYHKKNYRNLDFTLNGDTYHIVFSMEKKKKN